MAGSIKAMKRWADQIEDANTGYDQNQRWTFLDKANRRLRPNREADCSSVVAAVVWLAGYPINISGECWTGNLGELLKDAGWTIYKFPKLSQVKAGDVLIAPEHHTEFAYTANMWYSAHMDESGGATGGQAGNQPGSETKFRSAYDRSGGWTYLARPPADTATADTATIGDDMFNPYFIQVEGERPVYVVTSGAVVHVKNPTHLRFLIRGGIPEEIQKVTKQEMEALTEQE